MAADAAPGRRRVSERSERTESRAVCRAELYSSERVSAPAPSSSTARGATGDQKSLIERSRCFHDEFGVSLLSSVFSLQFVSSTELFLLVSCSQSTELPRRTPLELNMRNFPCEQCERVLFKEMRTLIQRANSAINKSESTAPNSEMKYFAQRFRLISRFNDNLNLR